MKRIGDRWFRVIAFENLLLAYRKARRGKASRAAVQRFDLELERALFVLQDELHAE